MKVLTCVILSFLLLFCWGCSDNSDRTLPSCTTSAPSPEVQLSSPSMTPAGSLYTIGVVASLEDDKFVYAREDKSLDSDKVGAAALGVEFAVTEQTDVWCRVIYGEKICYIMKQYLTIKSEKEALPQHEIFVSVPERQEVGPVETKFNNKLRIVNKPYSENGTERNGIDIYTIDGVLLAADASLEITDAVITAPCQSAENEPGPTAAVSSVPVKIVIKNGAVETCEGIDLNKDTSYIGKGKVVAKDKTVIEYKGEFLKDATVNVTNGMIYSPESSVEIQQDYYLVPKMLKDNLTDVMRYADDIEIDMLFAKDGNMLGDKIYDHEVCLLQKSTLEKLRKAAQIFKQNGYTIVIYDAYRPFSVTEKLYEKYKDGNYVAPVRFGSAHNKGASVDMSLLDSTGMPIEMPSPIHTLDSSSNRSNKNMSEAAKENMDYMTGVMVNCGFNIIESEWWHFTDSEYMQYLKTNYDLNSLLSTIYK